MLGLSVPLPLFSVVTRLLTILLFFLADLLRVATSFSRFWILVFIRLNFVSFRRSLFFMSVLRSVVSLWCWALSSVIWNMGNCSTIVHKLRSPTVCSVDTTQLIWKWTFLIWVFWTHSKKISLIWDYVISVVVRHIVIINS